MATSPNFSWPEPDNSDLVKNGALAIRTAVDAIDSSMADLKGGTTGQVLSKTSNTDMDFTWVAQDDSNAIQNAIVDAKGDLIAATAADTPARLAVGTNGQVLTADSTAATGLAWATASGGSTNVAGKNAVLNSAFNVWQRGTSLTIGSTYSADRWTGVDPSGARVISRQSTNDTTNLPFIQYCARIQRPAGNTNTGIQYFYQSMETVNSIPYAGKTVTMSFYARAGANFSPTSGTLSYFLKSGTGTDQNLWVSGYTGDATPISGTATLTTTWQRFTATGTVAASATELTTDFRWTPTGTAGAADYLEITGVQLEIASSASAYSPNTPTYQGELAACQRYYYKNPKTAISMGYATNGTSIFSNSFHPVEMRTTPTVIQTGGATFSSNTSATTFTVDANGSGTFYSMLSFLTGASNGLTYLYRVVEWSAEL